IDERMSGELQSSFTGCENIRRREGMRLRDRQILRLNRPVNFGGAGQHHARMRALCADGLEKMDAAEQVDFVRASGLFLSIMNDIDRSKVEDRIEACFAENSAHEIGKGKIADTQSDLVEVLRQVVRSRAGPAGAPDFVAFGQAMINEMGARETF